MARKYTLNRRAESQAETRRRIIEAAVELHGTVGPANTTVSMIAEKAGVQRHTFYAHFPDERSMLMACSGHTIESDPPPDAEAWSAIADPQERLSTGLRAIYDWYARNEGLVACVTRDAESHPLVREVTDLRLGPAFASFQHVLGAKLNSRQQAMLILALNFHSWRTLTREAGLKQSAAVTTMVQAILA
ncbi:MAG: helix-turn-helix domain-containing protein [Hyphomonadaceae bacterium]|nr:helix-turn-helix domain-containing protein [Hyphomonadaceae bacterium]